MTCKPFQNAVIFYHQWQWNEKEKPDSPKSYYIYRNVWLSVLKYCGVKGAHYNMENHIYIIGSIYLEID